MDKRLIKRTAIVVVAGGLAIGGWLGARGGDTIAAMGGTWASPDAQWTIDGTAFRGTLRFAPVRMKAMQVERIEILSSICDAALSDLEVLGAPNDLAANVYRLDLNVEGIGGDMIFERDVPVPVRNGTCVMDLFDDTFYPTYPAPLEGWFLSGNGMMNHGDFGVIPAIQFQNRPDADPSVADFDAVTACSFILNDPGAWVLQDGVAPVQGALRIKVRDGVSLGSLAFAGRFRDIDLTFADGTCEEVV